MNNVQFKENYAYKFDIGASMRQGKDFVTGSF
jgi:hypothetical protein